MRKRVFLGGTCNGSQWREIFKELLSVDYFDPVVEDWDDAARQRELEERKNDEIVLYCVTPLMTGVYAVAEVVDDSNKRPDRTVLLVLKKDEGSRFTKHQEKALDAVARMVDGNGARIFRTLEGCAGYCNDTLDPR